jgi:TRAP-type C4-dicarboxylate transport system substrate-binding protein
MSTFEQDEHLMRKLIVVSVVLVAACLSAAANPAPVVLKIATAAPEASTWVKAMRQSSAEIKERTQGRVTIKYYAGGIQGSDAQVLKKIRIGNLHGGAFTPSAMNDIYPDINLYSLPLTFKTAAEAEYVRERMDARLIAGLEEKGFVSFGFAATGFAMVMSGDPIRSVADLKGKKVWVPEGDEVSYKAMEALSVSPTALPLTDVMVGLQTELLDIVPVSPIGALFLQWHTRVKYVTDMPLVYTFGFMVVDKKMFDKIDPEDRAIVKDVISRMYARFDATGTADNEEAFQALLNSGIKKVVPNDAEVEEIWATMSRANRDLANEGIISIDLYNAMLQYRDEYRNSQVADSNKVAVADRKQ